ncbi:unnamed protein product [Mytilus edulis]|uniref:Uncharacterized protein n=1 Tax=Mytilus edulis TaxID=6550 RepID=A0A8S3S9W6_MYTED|nr:unnamed protein product [Mytilus edulis]
MNADQKAASSDCNVSTQNGLGMFQEYLLESNISGELLQGLLTDETYADDWAITKFQEPVWRQYFFWDMVLKTIEESQSLTFKENLPIVLSNLGFNNVNVSPFVRKIRNRVMVIVKKDNKLLGKDFALNLNSELDNLGPFCNEVGITLKWLENPCEIPIKTEIKKGLILEFRKAKIRFGFSVKQCSQWVFYLCSLDVAPNMGALQNQWESMYKRQLSQHKLGNERKVQYLNTLYLAPERKSVINNTNQTILTKNVCYENKNENENKEQKIVTDLRIKLGKSRSERYQCNVNIYKLKQENLRLKKNIMYVKISYLSCLYVTLTNA